MVDLAKHWGAGTVSLHAVAEREDLPEAYLEQLVAVLRRAGLVNGKRGAGGGYTLAREPREITAGDVVRAWAVQPAGLRHVVTRGSRADEILGELGSMLASAKREPET